MGPSKSTSHFGERQSTTLKLGCDSSIRMVRIEGALSVRVSCLVGSLWITQLGDRNDYILGPRECRHFPGTGTVVINPLRASICLMANEGPRPWAIRMDDRTAVVSAAASGLESLILPLSFGVPR